MINAGSIREHMDVVGSDGKHVGKVDHVLGSDLQLTRSAGANFTRFLSDHQIARTPPGKPGGVLTFGR